MSISEIIRHSDEIASCKSLSFNLRFLAGLVGLEAVAFLSPSKPKCTPKRKARSATRFPGIGADARTLGVNRSTLYRVLTGEWKQLKALRARYNALKKGV